MSGLELFTAGELLRRRQLDSPCRECVSTHYGLVANIIKWERGSFDYDCEFKGSLSIRVSCEKSLALERECPVMGGKGYKILLHLEGSTVYPIALVRSLE